MKRKKKKAPVYITQHTLRLFKRALSAQPHTTPICFIQFIGVFFTLHRVESRALRCFRFCWSRRVLKKKKTWHYDIQGTQIHTRTHYGVYIYMYTLKQQKVDDKKKYIDDKRNKSTPAAYVCMHYIVHRTNTIINNWIQWIYYFKNGSFTRTLHSQNDTCV